MRGTTYTALLISAAALLLGVVTPTKADTTAVAGSSSVAGSASLAGASAQQGNQQAITINSAAPAAITSAEHTGTSTVKTVAPVTAPNLTTTLTETCMGSTSVGGTVVGTGITVGTTWTDQACVDRLNAREMAAIGDKDAAKELLCNDPKIAAAYAAAGRPCKGVVVQPLPAKVASADPSWGKQSCVGFMCQQ